ncbi:hypothetical protein CAI16_00425 [Virgibacillus dokdonensis]|uniref:YugN family protein n=2 Tax=Virgibacillus TaxID=84406 RepID=A0A2K9J4E1_9BACI|nr:MULTISPECIES: YugN family protein [Virgibacillus]AUJ26797.1 YugN-like family protein [Virgibacillus dokdonensis]RFA37607.1 hypothetical protein CAI16_00425 [Virgibacillus dokdonensis]SHG88659.1 YugN-like family protein [Virgibacillus chiguensis]
MKLENTGLEEEIIDLKPLDHVTAKHAFIRAGQWDYERVTYDYRIDSDEKGITYYIRIQGYAVEGDVDRGDAVIQMLTPLLGKHYYPHGVEYGEEENFPSDIVERAKSHISQLKTEINQLKQ